MSYSRLLQLGLVLSVMALGGCGDHKASPTVAPKVEGEVIIFPAESVQQKALQSASVEPVSEDNLRVSGRLVWDETRTVRVAAPLAGRIVRLAVQPGEVVKAGAVLAVLSSPAFGEAQADASKAAADFVVAQKSLERAHQLNQAGITADKDLQRAQAEFDRAEAEKKRTAARSKAYGGSNGVEQELSLRAPIAGVVVERNANPGQEVRADAAPDERPLFVISDPTRLWVNLDLPEAAIGSVKSGMELSLRVAALGDEVLNAKIEHVADFIDPASRTTRARAMVNNADRRLKAEMFVTAEITVKDKPFVRLPASAVILLGQQQFIFIDEGNGRYRRLAVSADEAGFGRMRIKDELPATCKVVIDGALLLQQIIATAK